MTNQIPPGAYIIRNGKGSVLEIHGPAFAHWSWTIASEENEVQFRDQQIWWVEQLPDSKDDDREMICSITSTSSGKALGLRNGEGALGRY